MKSHALAIQRVIQACALTLILAMGAGNASAQQNMSLDNAVAVATHWVAQADDNQADTMWQNSGQLMRKSVSKNTWSHYLGTQRKQLGTLQSRDWLQLARVTNPDSLPAGEYVNVIFTATYANASMLETVSLAQTSNGWVPVGYVIHPIRAVAAPAKPVK
ncbi:DUF4019 domain-containing protein [Dyella tabacisoli]|nr:DUF4019 domain-containing protein [Dyella tabacisoli]